ncbi:hypothetical protein GS429_13765 [Natronorubrum sp. JWXQ-INN-674]|uniref:DUF7344 domain-containing protein n=1 Tax=Natronorubrum halalkaliphilum TaxID=2691917 RepID=A0A6B0VPD5_9EURY|nr:hypothetical protein [Natronorubrum halalkaliphilum]MXV63115.1 hypothetical protein [Natronorubrum halalkaliphilum]
MNAESLDVVYGLLSEARRRYVLYYFLDNEHANIDGLSLQIAAWERDLTVDAVSEDHKQTVMLSLIHSHLPKLADHRLVEYDDRTGDVIADDEFDDIRSTVSRARTDDEQVEVTGDSKESFLYSEPLARSANNDQSD